MIERQVPVRDEGVKLIVGEAGVGWQGRAQGWQGGRASSIGKTRLTVCHCCSTLLVLP